MKGTCRRRERENRLAEEEPVEVTFFSVELESKPSSVPDSVGRTFATCHGWEAAEKRSLLSNFAKEVCTRLFCDVLRDLVLAICTSTLCMDNPLRNSFMCGMGDCLEEIDVL